MKILNRIHKLLFVGINRGKRKVENLPHIVYSFNAWAIRAGIELWSARRGMERAIWLLENTSNLHDVQHCVEILKEHLDGRPSDERLSYEETCKKNQN